MIDNNKRKSLKGYELKILSSMLNDLNLIPEIAGVFSEDSFSDNHRELFIKICELGKNQKDSTLLIDDLCKLNITNWKYRELQKLKDVGKSFTKDDVKSAVKYLLNASLPFEQDKNLLSTVNQNNGHIKLVNARELQTMELKPINWVIKDLLPEGLLILAGRPKIGKSFLALNMSLAIANGGHALGYFRANKNSVLYIPYEDNYRRLQDRINRMLAEEHYKEAPSNLFIPKDCDFPKMTIEGIDSLGKILDDNNDIKLVVLDTLGRSIVRSNKRNANQFQDEYDFLSVIQKIALQRHISILLVHHTTKMRYEDVFDQVLGTTGLTASPDSLMLLSKDSNKEFSLAITGRDIEEKEYTLKFQNCIWIIEGEKGKTTTPEREEIISLFLQQNRPLKTKEIAEYLGKTETNVCNMLKKIPEIVKVKYGEYVLNTK
ncbi:MAG: hypothetical protein A2455_12645 [Ignavibacteria bacterium RIFOXYC2_FULL_35_16]|nr:MAG: hypothetical protein A2058_15755 [Ignavibacteria bacterium GWA2_36_19]OGU62601.1 MAG: hypothetical protein A2X60_07970 [Ignavibacteria bacterium GWF2_35_20]OGU89642.1 MAG: hypothetical protein A3K31_15780 [Ignavibacteria bacterium RIFOXYA12_FULL_35_25]OGU94662.1 MAG: hypothetical protein A2347_03380 [Ignavibacteria bacterium RIFOXYB12_FULL_35_14]OGV01650.1 MAG: hypothetical protein A2455_12645 [Ignavibacteria bacterium RIFOXYC2_FULL_35_16]OGV32767.1 MAG: hypothetical protein A2523_1328